MHLDEPERIDAVVTWTDIEWLVASTRVPVIGKGVIHPDDALRACAAGLAAVVALRGAYRTSATCGASLPGRPAERPRPLTRRLW
ncbi:alpha-hydroxy-acid oxidizing protein [Streptomyces sp. HNM1019]|uniref:alpha-hydroxy-acid oxidizing protein n=1 Tax=Streptomyces sp. HNM1019 TaxID=3424717 RepID=UPI003D788B5B